MLSIWTRSNFLSSGNGLKIEIDLLASIPEWQHIALHMHPQTTKVKPVLVFGANHMASRMSDSRNRLFLFKDFELYENISYRLVSATQF